MLIGEEATARATTVVNVRDPAPFDFPVRHLTHPTKHTQARYAGAIVPHDTTTPCAAPVDDGSVSSGDARNGGETNVLEMPQ